jgi:hypothetical protein
MPLNERKIIQIILDQCTQVQERCQGYRQELIETISEIVSEERRNRVQATNIQIKVNDKISASGRFLANKRGQLD